MTFFKKGFIFYVPIDISCQFLAVETPRNVKHVWNKAKSLRLTILNAFCQHAKCTLKLKMSNCRHLQNPICKLYLTLDIPLSWSLAGHRKKIPVIYLSWRWGQGWAWRVSFWLLETDSVATTWSLSLSSGKEIENGFLHNFDYKLIKGKKFAIKFCDHRHIFLALHWTIDPTTFL